MKPELNLCLSDNVTFTPSLGAASFTALSNVDSAKRGGCYQLTRPELQGKGRVADKLSKWDLGTAPGTAHDLPTPPPLPTFLWLITAEAMELAQLRPGTLGRRWEKTASPCPQT